MITTTLNRILACNPCGQRLCPSGKMAGWLKLLDGLGKSGPDDEPLPYAVILHINGLGDALWACQCEPAYDHVWRILAVQYARRVQHLMSDQRSIAALDMAERYAGGLATDSGLAAARAAAQDAARAAAWDAAVAAGAAAGAAGAAAQDAARAAAWAAWAAAWAAAVAAGAAAGAAGAAAQDAARAAAWAARDAARAAAGAAGAAARAAAWDAERDAQVTLFLEAVS